MILVREKFGNTAIISQSTPAFAKIFGSNKSKEKELKGSSSWERLGLGVAKEFRSHFLWIQE